eukprot:TRINITY_DN29034_c0_g1_i1.p1 TRINITY_DN29034_c0_g1~~TRINITY_DN29034_c0_g1_i1.p1  ORF type:complete len:1041 (-),score=300.48 TRINITY_DN29034_c0_g1_i1:228-3350(-)
MSNAVDAAGGYDGSNAAAAHRNVIPAGVDPKDIVIEKPQTDHREYRYVVLPNSMQAIVISDSKCDKAAASLSVKVGSAFDPKEVQGLAHFLEHMLFLGTEKYPDEAEYNKFLAKNGGMSNAYTADDVTNFFFGVSPVQLEEALDRFSQFFLSPLFTDTATDRELQAVDSEHSKNQQSDTWRTMQMLLNDANPKHPMCHFGTGNYETLKTLPEAAGVPVREHLLRFHSEYYSANIMCLAVLGKESLDDLEAMVKRKFSDVANKNVSVPDGPNMGKGEPAFVKEDWPRYVKILPVKDVRNLTFQFFLEQQWPMRWRTQPTKYLSFLIGHEGKGSLLSALKARQLATGLMAGPSNDECGFCNFEVKIQLTEKGEDQVQLVGELTFTYIRLMQQLPVSEELWRENRNIGEMGFRFRATPNPISVASSLAHTMQSGLPVDKLFSAVKVVDLDKEEIAEVASKLCCGTMRLEFATKKFKEAEDCPETEKWYGTRYGAGKLPSEWHEAWEGRRTGAIGAATVEEAGAEFGLALPLPNPFVAEKFDLKPRVGEIPLVPRRVQLPEVMAKNLGTSASSSPGRVLQVYCRQDDKFDLPKANLNVEIYSPFLATSVENRVAVSAWINCASEELAELSYDSSVAGLSYALSASSQGVSVRLGGYDDKLPILLDKVVETLRSLSEVSEHTFGLVHTVLLRNAKNAAKTTQPYQQCGTWMGRATSRTLITPEETLAHIEGLTAEKLRGFNEKVFESCYVEALLQGNYAESEVGLVFEPLLPLLQPKKAADIVPLGHGILPCAPGEIIMQRFDGTNPEEKNGAVILSLQASEESLENTTLVELAAQVLSQRCFDELRTKQQLGYIVALQASADLDGLCGLKVIVQSEKHPAEVQRRIDAWLKPALEQLVDSEGTSDETLAEYLEALLTLKKEKPKKLADEFGRNWGEIRARHFRFTRRDEVVAFLERPREETLREFRTYVREKLLTARRMTCQVLGAVAKEKAAKVAESGADASEEDVAEVRPYEGAVQVLESLAEVEAFRSKLTFMNTSVAIEA